MDKSKSKMKDLIEQFCSITGADRDTGRGLLEACDGNLELAVNMHMEGGGASGSSAPPEEDTVRAPIPQTEEMLVEDASAYAHLDKVQERYCQNLTPAAASLDSKISKAIETANFRGRKRKNRSVFDGFRDFQEEARQQEAELQAVASGSGTGARSSKKTKTLQDLFRPPIDITYKGTFYNARDAGKTQGKWLMVNIQNVQEFSCQALNRDIWSNTGVKALIKNNFIFWQVYHDSEEGQKYCQFYKVLDWPYVAVLDPQTGENLITWSKIEPLTFCDLVSEFLAQHPTIDSTSPPAKRVRKSDSIVDATEDDQLQAALKASLTEVTHKPPATASVSTDSDSDLNSDLETFTDSDQTPPASPAKSRTRSRSPKSPQPQSQRSRSNTPEKRCSPRRNSGDIESGKIATDTSSKRTSKRCRSPLVKNSDKPDSLIQKDGSPKPCCTASLKKASPQRHKSSPLKTASPQKSASIHNNVHPAVLQNIRKSLDDSGPSEEVAETSGDKQAVIPSESDTSDTSVNDSFQSTVADGQDYTAYLGKETDEKTTLMLRLPNGQREKLCIPFSSKLLAVVLFVGSKGFSNERFELVAHFPHRQLSKHDFDSTLTEVGLNSQETIFVQART